MRHSGTLARGWRRRITQSARAGARSAHIALMLSLFAMLLSACGATSGSASATTPSGSASPSGASATPAASPSIPTPIAHAPLPPGIRGAGINVEPSYRPWVYEGGPSPQSWWCVSPNCSPDVSPRIRIDTDLANANRLGVNFVRVEFPWRFLEPQRGVFDWTRADLIVQEANYYHVSLQPIVVYSPAWVGSPTSAPAPQDFSDFMKALVGRYHASIHYWELWNEPDLNHYWSAGERAYVQDILIPGNQGAKAADPTAKIIFGGPSWASGDWVNNIYAYGGGDSFDIASWHSYGSVSVVLASAGNMRGLLAAHHQSYKPLWLGEFGVQDSSPTDGVQSALLTGVLTSNSPIAQADWYTLRDESAMSCCPPAIAASASWGLVGRDGVRVKAGFTTLQHLISAGLPAVAAS